MSINAKGIQLFLWRIIKFSGICCYKFVRKFPDISGVLIFVLCLYIFFPRVFLYFMYTSPILAGTAVYIRFYLKPKYAESKKDGGERLSAGGKIVNASDGPSLRPQKSVRRNARKEVLEWHGGEHSEPRTTYDSSSSKTNLLEENSKISFDRKGKKAGDQALDRNLIFDNETLNPHRVSGDGDGGGGELEVKSFDNKTARDDKKDRMDPGPGLAATERYKRLESLIAKRRAKKLFRMAIEKSLKGLHNVPPSQLGPILMAKINNGVSSNLDGEELRIPGSAPSFKQDSFDLPYGPQEEKPNLMPANQKEMLFSRHESFCRGPWSQFITTRNPNCADFNAYYDAEKRIVEGKPVEESMNLSDEEKEKIIETSNDRIEIEGENMENPHDQEPGFDTDSIKNNDSCYSSSSENTEHVSDQTIKPPGICNDHVPSALKLTIPRKGRATNRPSFDSIPSPYRPPCHTPTYSIASDLQVEVSEVGSPPLETDGTASSVDGDSVIYDGDVERDINSESEELWGGSFNLSREEANRERLRELDHIIEEEPIEVASTSPSEHEAKKNSNSQHTRTLSELNTRGALNAVQSKSNVKSIPDITVDQSAGEDNILNRRLRDSIARAVNRRLMFEQFSISSSLSPKSLIPQIIPADQVPISENMAKNNLAYEQARENLTSNTLQISHESVENSLDRSSDNFSLGELKALKKVIEKGNKNIKSNEDQSVFLIRPGDISGHGKSNEREADMNETEAIGSDYTIIVESAKERENSAAKVDRICKVDKSVADNKTNEEIKNDILEHEGALRILDKLKAVIEPSNGETSAGSIEETEHEFKRLVEAEANRGLTTSEGETSCLNDIKNDENMQNTTSQGGVVDAWRSGEFREENLEVIESILNVDNIACLSTSTGETNSLNDIKNDEKMQNMTCQEGADESQSGEVREDNLKVIESILNIDNISTVLSIDHEVIQASKSTECEVEAAELMKYDTGIDQSKSEKEKPKSDDNETMEPIDSLKIDKEGNIVKNSNDLEANEKEGENLTTNEGEHRFSITQEGVVAPEKSNELELDLNKTEPVESDYTSLVETAKERENSAAEVDRICKVNESASDNVINKETETDVLKREDALQILDKLESVMESTNTTGESSLGSVEDTEHESKRLAEVDSNMTRQEGIADASQSGEDNLEAIDIISNVDNITKGTSIDRDIDASQSGEDNLKAIDIISNVDNVTKGTSIDRDIDASQSGEDNLMAIDIISNVDNVTKGTSIDRDIDASQSGEDNLMAIDIISNVDNITKGTSIDRDIDASQSGEDNLKAIDIISNVDNVTKGTSIDRDIDVNASKPTESEFKTIETDEKDSNAVAK